MQPGTKTKEIWVELLTTRWEQASGKAAQLAKAFPEEKLDTKLIKGARTFGGVLRHLAFWNQYVADSLRGKQADDSLNELSPEHYSTKDSVVEALEQTSQATVAAIKDHPALDSKSIELVFTFIEHTCEHYGQMVVYARIAGIVPPASRA